MRITNVTAHPLSSPIEPVQARSFHGGIRRLHKRDFVLVVVETADGTRGIGPGGASSSAMREFFEGASQAAFAETINEEIAPVLEGESLDHPSDVHRVIDGIDLPGQIGTQTASAIDVACFDIYGKQHGTSVSTLLADEHETDVTPDLPLYASAGMYMEPAGYVRQAELLEELGFWGYKYRPGIGPAGDRETVELLADATTDIEILLDCHTWWKGDTAYAPDVVDELVEHAATHGAGWVEEPVEPDDYDGYRRLTGRGVPLAGGESEPDVDGLVALGETGAVSYLQGDVRHHRGFTGCWEAVEFCAGTDVNFVPHNFGTWLGLVANAHLVAAGPECSLVEYPVFEDDPALDGDGDPGMYPFELAFDLIEEDLVIEDGSFTVPDEPGLGVTLNEDVIEEYPFIEGPWTTFEPAA